MLGVINVVVGSFPCGESTLGSNSRGRAPCGRNFPYLQISGSIGGKVDPRAVARPAGNGVVETVLHQGARCATVRIDDENGSGQLPIQSQADVERNRFSIGGPARRASG